MLYNPFSVSDVLIVFVSLLNFDWFNPSVVIITAFKLLNDSFNSSTAFSPSLFESHSLNSPSLALSYNESSTSITFGTDIFLVSLSVVIFISSKLEVSTFFKTPRIVLSIDSVDSPTLSSYALSKSSNVLNPCFSKIFIISLACVSDIWSLGFVY